MERLPPGIFQEAAAAHALLATTEGESRPLPLGDGDWTGGMVAAVLHGLANGTLAIVPEAPAPDAPYV